MCENIAKNIKKLFKKKTGRNLSTFAGDDGALIYWVECLDCGTVIKSDHSHPFINSNWKCPTCIKQDVFHFQHWTKKEINNIDGGEYFNHLKETYKKHFRGE